MNEKVNIKRIDGSTIAADLVCFIENTTTNKRYLYYTLNEVVGTGDSSTVKIYVSKIQQNNPTLDTPISEEDWNKLKGYMGDTLKGNNNPEVKYVPLSELGEPISLSEKAIAMPVNYDYINKQRSVYATNVATIQVTPTSEPIIANPVEQMVVPTPIVEPTPSAPIPEPIIPISEPTPVEPVIAPTIEVAPQSIEPTITPAIETPVIQQVAPTTMETPIPPVIEEPKAVVTPTVQEETILNNNTNLTPIDLNSIEQKYAEMIQCINNLKEQELEAAKRYNATLELSSMHKEQHANYVQNEQIKENTTETLVVPSDVPIEPQTITIEQPVIPNETSSSIEPTPVIPVVPEPVVATPADIETNWFDMPANNVQ